MGSGEVDCRIGEVEDGRYFVTIHLAGAIPASGEERIRLLSEELSRKSSVSNAESGLLLSRTIFREMETWLDCSKENLLLADPAVAEMVVEAIQHRVKTVRWIVYRFVIMPNHIHLFMSVLKTTLKESLEDFKRWTGHQAAKLVDLPNDRFWQDECLAVTSRMIRLMRTSLTIPGRPDWSNVPKNGNTAAHSGRSRLPSGTSRRAATLAARGLPKSGSK